MDWPISRSGNGRTTPVFQKVPSQIRYLENGEFEWGDQISTDANSRDVHKLFKLYVLIMPYKSTNI